LKQELKEEEIEFRLVVQALQEVGVPMTERAEV
jgi:hypothetical protein